MINAAWHWQYITPHNPISPSPRAPGLRTNINVKLAFYTQTPLIPLRELLAVYSNVSPSIFCNFLQTLVPPAPDPGLSQVNNIQSMFRIRFRIFSVPYRAEMSIRNPTPPGTQPHTITLNPKPSARNLSNPSFSSNLSNLCHCATSYPDPPSKLGSSPSPQTKPQPTNTLRLVFRGRGWAIVDVRMSVL